ncbi:MAG: hypothetical protein U0235_17790 [Polyangiaceae bacterium]
MKDDDRRPTPGKDLQSERDLVVRSFFKRGAELTEQLVAENERLRTQIRELEIEATRMRTLLASDSAARELLAKISELENEKRALLEEKEEAEALSTRFGARQGELEDEIGALASLFVAVDNLHRCRSVDEATRTLADLLGQLVGARTWAAYVVDDDVTPPVLRRFAESGESPSGFDETIAVGAAKTPLARAIEVALVTGETRLGAAAAPAAATLPLHAGTKSAGVVAIVDLLPHKAGLTDVDRRLFDLLSTHFAPAAFAALAEERGESLRTTVKRPE